jgi:hypothetical protein
MTRRWLALAIGTLIGGCGTPPETVGDHQEALTQEAAPAPASAATPTDEHTARPGERVRERLVGEPSTEDPFYGSGPMGWSWNYYGNSYFPGGNNYFYSGFNNPGSFNYLMIAAPYYCMPRFGNPYLWTGYNSYYPMNPYYSTIYNNYWYGIYAAPYGINGYSGLGFSPYANYATACPLTYYTTVGGYPYYGY